MNPEALQKMFAPTPRTKKPWEQAAEGELARGQEFEPLRPLVPPDRPEPFPVGMLPPSIRAAVEEVVQATQAPEGLVAACALGTVSSVVQGLADVARSKTLVGPISLNVLTIATSGERKTTVDNLFTQGVRAWQTESNEVLKAQLQRHQGYVEAWSAQEAGIKDALKKAARDGDRMTAERLGHELADHAIKRPPPPLAPKLLRQDDTPERLAHALAEWPVAAVVSSEAGIIFGSHGMSEQVVMRNLAQANALWDGGAIERGRVGTGDLTVEGARVSMSLQLQPQVFRAFFDKAGVLARGIGYFARFLIDEPESTKGGRFWEEPPSGMPALTAFIQRSRALLNTLRDQLVQSAGKPSRCVLHIESNQPAKQLWVGYYDSVEEELAKGGDYYEVDDVAAKSAEQAARLWANFVVWEGATDSEAQERFMHGAVLIARHYLNAQLRFSQTTAVPTVVRNAQELEAWVCKRCIEHKLDFESMKAISQFGPYATRQKPARDDAIAVLVDHGRMVPGHFGKKAVLIPDGTVLREHGAREPNR